MLTLLNKLKSTLQKDKRLISEDGELLKNKIIELALKFDKELIHSLMKEKDLKEHFFTEVDKIIVFDQLKFIKFVDNKEFLPDSYTTFKNKVGLTVEDNYLSQNKEVVLSWPYKDCVLEGGMEKEDEKRNEVFFNEILAPDEIDRLKEPKVFSNFKRIDAKGEHKVTEIKPTDNLIIRGNNLLALYSLKKKFAGRIKLIYIDPPYNRQEGDFGYNDSFNHSTWLTFMRNRLEVAKELLSKEGAIFISIDDNEQAHLKVLCDEIFLRDNFLCNIAYERSGVSGLGQGGQFLVNTHENIICYARSKPDLTVVDFSGEGEFSYEDMKRYNKILLSVGKRKEVDRFIAPSTKEEVVIYKHEGANMESISLKSFDKRKNEIYNQHLKNFEKIFRNTVIQEENEFQNKILSYCKDGFYSADYLVSRGKRKGEKITAYYIDGQVFAWLKDTAKIEDGKIIKTNKLSDFWPHEDIPKADLANEGGVKLRRGKKPENLLRRLIKLVTKEGDWILDFFLGSGTSAAVAHKMNRHYIGVEQLDYENNDSVIRLRNVIGKENGKGKLHPVIENYDTTGISKAVNWKGGGDFVYCELMKWNDNYIDEIKKAKSSKELIKVWKLMQEKAFLSYKVNPEDFDKNAKKFKQLSLENQKKFLIECLDKNQLYVNLSEIDDSDYGVSKEDKDLNKKFYGAL